MVTALITPQLNLCRSVELSPSLRFCAGEHQAPRARSPFSLHPTSRRCSPRALLALGRSLPPGGTSPLELGSSRCDAASGTVRIQPPGQRRSLGTLRSPRTHEQHSLPREGQSPGWQVWISPPPASPAFAVLEGERGVGGRGEPPPPALSRLRSPQVARRRGCGAGDTSASCLPVPEGRGLLSAGCAVERVSQPQLGFSLKSMGEGGETRG